MAEDIYYNDLENYDHDVDDVLELKAEKVLLEERIKEMTNTMQVINKEYDDLKQKYNDMSTNFSSLIKTVRAELGRKDRIIADLDREKHEIIFNKHRTGTYQPKFSLEEPCRKSTNLPTQNYAQRPNPVPMNQRVLLGNSTWALTHRDVSKQKEGLKGDYSEDSTIRNENINTNTITGDRGRRRSDKDEERHEIIFNKHRPGTYHPPKVPPEEPQRGRKRTNSPTQNYAKRPNSVPMNQRVNNSTCAPTHGDVSKQREGLKDYYSEDSTIRNENVNTNTITGDRARRRSDKDEEKDEITFNEHRPGTNHPPKVPPEEPQEERKRRNSPIRNLAKRPKSVPMNQRVNNSTCAPTHRDVSKQEEGFKDDYSEDSNIRNENINTNTITGDRGRRRSDKDQEKTTTSTRSRIKSTPDRQYAKFNTVLSKTNNRSRSNDKNIRRTLREDSSRYLSKRSRYRNKSYHNKYDKKSNSREIDYQSRVLRSPSIECRSRNSEFCRRTYGRPKSQRNRTPSRERESTRSRGSREKRDRDKFRSKPKGIRQEDYEKDETPYKTLDSETYFFSTDSVCMQGGNVIPLKCDDNSQSQCLSIDPVTFADNDPRSGQYSYLKEGPDLKIIPLYKDDNTSETNDITQEWCAESPNSKEWSFESALVSDSAANINQIEKYDEPVNQEMSIKDELQELIPNTKVLAYAAGQIISTKEQKKEQRRSTKESEAKTTRKEKKNDQNETTHKKSKKSEDNKMKEHNAALSSDDLQNELANLESSSYISNEGLNESMKCSINKMDLKEDTNTATKTISINTREPNFMANNSHKAPLESEPNGIQVTDVIKEFDSGIVVQKEISQNYDLDVKVSKNNTLHKLGSKDTVISEPNKALSSPNSTVPNTSHTHFTKTAHQTDLENENTSVSKGYDAGMVISTLNNVKEDNVLKMKETVCSQGNSNISALNIIETNDSKENDITIGNKNEIPKISPESQDITKQNKLMIRRRKTVVKRKE